MLTASGVRSSEAATLYTAQGPITVNDNGVGSNLPGMTVSRGTTASDVVYFRFVAKPISDFTNENYFAGLELFQGVNERLGVGNGFAPFAYSAFNTTSGDVDLNSATPEPSTTYQFVRSTDLTRIIFRVQYVSGGVDHIKVWLNPDPGLTEAAQPAALTTTFDADATFDELHLREGSGAGGWTFSDIAVASSFDDLRGRFVDITSGPLGGTDQSYGVAWGDYDTDGDLDLVISTDQSGNKLFRNDGGGSFVDTTPSPFGNGGLGISAGVNWGDYDKDGDLDLFTAHQDGNKLFRNDGAGVFTNATKSPMGNLLGNEGAAWADYDTDGDLDLFVTGENKLLRNDAGVFTDATSGPLLGSGNGPVATWGDYDNDGDPDLFVTAFHLPSKLFRNDGGGVFADVTSGAMGDTESNFGAAWGDYDNDGDLDLYLARLDTSSKLFRNNGGGVFADATSGPLGLSAAGGAWGDYDNDGDLDLYLTRSSASNKLLRNDGAGVFADATIGPLGNAGGVGSGSAWGDYDSDGDLDLYVANANGQNELLRNEATVGNHWLQVKLRGVSSSREGIGARVRVVSGGLARIRELSGGSGYLSQDALVASFGLGTATSIDSLIVRWPSGIVQVASPVPAVDGVVTVVERGQTFTRLFSTSNSFGGAWGDYDKDGDLDLVVTHYPANLLLRNNGGAFADVASGPLATPLPSSQSQGVVWGDYDNDTDLDLYVSRDGEGNKLFRNDGGTFVDATHGPLGGPYIGRATAWGDYDRDGDLDLYLATEGSPNKLFRNDVGTFVDATTGPLAGPSNSMGTAWADYDNDGDLDLYISVVFDSNKLLRNDAGTFVDVTSGPLANPGFNSIGCAWGDYDNDADLDLVVASQGHGVNLFRNDGGTWVDATAAPLGGANGNAVAWGDYDNDGDLDLYLTKSSSPGKLFRNDGGGVFADVTSGPQTGGFSDVAWGDYDNDGDLDLFASNGGLLINHNATGNHWFQVALRGTVSNRAAIGARVTVKAGGITRIDEVSGGSGYLSQNSLMADFGLGASTTVDSLVVRWPSGIVQAFHTLAADRRVSLIEGSAILPVDGGPALPPTIELAAAAPNPFQNATHIDYALPTSGHVRLTVHDVQGRRVTTLVDGEHAAGRYSAKWDGTVADGTRAGAGVYFVCLKAGDETGGQTVFRKVVCTK